MKYQVQMVQEPTLEALNTKVNQWLKISNAIVLLNVSIATNGGAYIACISYQIKITS